MASRHHFHPMNGENVSLLRMSLLRLLDRMITCLGATHATYASYTFHLIKPFPAQDRKFSLRYCKWFRGEDKAACLMEKDALDQGRVICKGTYLYK